MRDTYLQERVARAEQAASGRWKALFVEAGMDPSHFAKRNRPCPLCGGTDRFSFDNKFGRGNYFCRVCGPGSGLDLLCAFRGVSFMEGLSWLESACGIVPPAPERRSREAPDEEEHCVQPHLRVWQEASPLRPGDPVWQYLSARGLNPARVGPDVRCHPKLAYLEEGETRRRVFPAMIARVTDAEGVVINVHRTYLEDGRKAPVESPKKLMAGPVKGGAVQLAPVGETLGLAEGVETALAASELFDVPVWALLGCTNLADFTAIPPGVRRVIVFGDRDASFAGQAAAYAVAHQLAQRGLAVEVQLPEKTGEDWLDVLNARRA